MVSCEKNRNAVPKLTRKNVCQRFLLTHNFLFCCLVIGCNASGVSISQTHATIGLGIFSALVLMWLLSGIFWWTLFSSGFLVAVHAVLRDASMHQDTEDQVDMVGEVTGESAAFLGQSAGAHNV